MRKVTLAIQIIDDADTIFSHQMPRPYDKQVTWCLQHGFHRNAVRRIDRTRLKIRHGATHVTNFVTEFPTVTTHLYAAASSENATIVAKKTFCVAPDIVEMFVLILVELQKSPLVLRICDAPVRFCKDVLTTWLSPVLVERGS
ncbi:hypothetical protein TNCV_4639471 [Trichonephila clavipes]|nr:hypothetical protein TNCV_4639471 [Trichonephila clavipes]